MTHEYSAWGEVTPEMRAAPGVDARVEQCAHDYIDRIYGGEFTMRGHDWTWDQLTGKWTLTAWADR